MTTTPATGTSYATQFLVPGSILMGLTVLISYARFYFRWRPHYLLRWDDYALAVSLLLTMAWFVVVAVMYSYGRGVVGRRQQHLSILGPMEVTSGILWFWSMNIIRISMCFMILRLKASRGWKWSMWSLIAVQVGLMVSATAVTLGYCRPVAAAWIPRPDSVCLKPSQLNAFAYVYNAFNIASDLILSLIPLAFISKIHRPLGEKLLICGLMAAGLSASVFGVLRMVLIFGKFGLLHEALLQVRTDQLCGFELMVATIAASLPCLKGPTERTMRRLGFFEKPRSIEASPNSFLSRMTHGSHVRHQIDELPLRAQTSEA